MNFTVMLWLRVYIGYNGFMVEKNVGEIFLASFTGYINLVTKVS
jgi:hypothetical protein